MLFIIDFDGTLSVRDTVDAMLEKFADPSWEEIEKTWLDGKITAIECMTQQVRMVKADHIAVESFFRSIQLDASFLPFYQHIIQFAKVAIVSDGLDHAIKVATRHAAFPEIPIYANHLSFVPNGLDITFPLRNMDCKAGNGVCKCKIADDLALESGGPIVLIGDGKSDACLSGYADIVFAKGSLIKHCEKNDTPHHKFESFADVFAEVKKWQAGAIPQQFAQKSAHKTNQSA
ncbi:MtnX-like HAD-IB family phosphatase [Methyloradius palustris]|uniref:2,3-diketo-5-methylthio-1-phosphopentane phosphatase n=1 Tax=Methyloradius palustris TaxID=2778876 RepID=A0A8D5JS63_9PROT|nr:MtnX-like HAD-IB family phosphatase [Methyloradius palustris]BCM26126.1 2,3-diketo-5-methylthio-1-phosphopentane phosphatase [Methyloradius palustris]